MAVVEVSCIACGGKKVIKHGQAETGDQRYRCKENGCGKTFKLTYRYKARENASDFKKESYILTVLLILITPNFS